MQCPSCYARLERCKYEGLPVSRCMDCLGYLVSTQRVENIQHRRGKSTDELKAEAQVSFDERTDSSDTLKCPRCHLPMEKENWKHQDHFRIDKCLNCNVIWFDAGELALVQLQFEDTDQAQEAMRFKQRLQEMTESEKAEFERNLAELPEGDASEFSGFGQGLAHCLGELAEGISKKI